MSGLLETFNFNRITHNERNLFEQVLSFFNPYTETKNVTSEDGADEFLTWAK